MSHVKKLTTSERPSSQQTHNVFLVMEAGEKWDISKLARDSARQKPISLSLHIFAYLCYRSSLTLFYGEKTDAFLVNQAGAGNLQVLNIIVLHE